jgi:hypothetical protein
MMRPHLKQHVLAPLEFEKDAIIAGFDQCRQLLAVLRGEAQVQQPGFYCEPTLYLHGSILTSKDKLGQNGNPPSENRDLRATFAAGIQKGDRDFSANVARYSELTEVEISSISSQEM